MIDSQTEELLTLADAASRVPGRKPGKRLNPATLWRWHKRGVKGIKLETLVFGGTRFTSAQALQRFGERCAAAADGMPQATVAQRTRAHAAAEAELIAAGM